MNLEKIEGLIKLVEASSLTQFTYKEGDIKITMSKLDNPPRGRRCLSCDPRGYLPGQLLLQFLQRGR